MDIHRKLSDAEFDIMEAVWNGELPATVGSIKTKLKKSNWKPQTIHTLLLRLESKGFVRSEKSGKERFFFPLITREDYLKTETAEFMSRYFSNSFTSFITTFYGGGEVRASDIDELEKWLEERRE